MTDPLAEIIGDYKAFAAQQRDRFEDFTHVKFHQRPLRETAEMTGSTFGGLQNVEGRMPQRLVTATGPTPLAR